MPAIRLGAAALNLTPLAWETNRRHIVAALESARTAGVSVLCLPELCISGYGCEDMFFSAGLQQTALELLGELVPTSHGLFTAFGIPLRHDGALFNAVAVACDGQLRGIVCKQHLAGDGIHYEPRWFTPWPNGIVETAHINGQQVPIGDLLFDCQGIRIGFEICRDAWVANRPGAQLARRGANVILNPSASHFAFGKQELREEFVTVGSQEFGVCYAYANLLGNESGRAIYEGGSLLAADGKIVARGPRFSFADVVLTHVAVTVPSLHMENNLALTSDGLVPCSWKCETSSPPAKNQTTSLSFVLDADGRMLPARTVEDEAHAFSQVLASSIPKREDFTRAVPLALFDYLRKTGARGFVISLSGGADSSSTAVMVYLMVALAGHELGWRPLATKLRHVQAAPGEDSGGWMRKLLACVYQATRNSTNTTRQAARQVAQAIGADYFEWQIDETVDGYVSTVSSAVRHEFTWEEDDRALQNIQARARGPAAWLLANLRQAILLTTSNRSEAAVGYATMDGDTCGGLAPIAGIDKAFLRNWLRWLEHAGPEGIGPLAFLSVVNAQQPTAELRPPTAGQTDEADLMPYQVLDAIERAAIRDKRMPLEVWQSICFQFREYDAGQLGKWVERFFQLWCQNQWKRERYAPSFHLDDENLDPKTWCRFPILNGGYERELQQLREKVDDG